MPQENPVRPSSDHRRRVTIVLTVLSALIVVDLVVRANASKLAPYRWDSYYQKLEGLRSQSPKPQIILLGSSRARFGLVPEVFENLTGKRTFNAGIDGSQVLECRRIAEDYIEKLRPELVVLGVNARAFREDYLPIPAACHLFSWDDFLHYCHTDGWSSKVDGRFIHGDWLEHEGEYDLVTFISSLHHFEDWKAAVDRAFSLLAPDGIVIIDQEPTRFCARLYREYVIRLRKEDPDVYGRLEIHWFALPSILPSDLPEGDVQYHFDYFPVVGRLGLRTRWPMLGRFFAAYRKIMRKPAASWCSPERTDRRESRLGVGQSS